MDVSFATIDPRHQPHPIAMRSTHVFAAGITFICAAALFITGCGSDAQSQDTEEENAPVAVPVEAAVVEEGDISAFFGGTASLEAEEEAVVVAKAGGIVQQIFVEEGTYVEAGRALAKLDDERLALDLARTETTLNKLQREYDRQQEMYDKQLVSTEEYESARSDFETQKTSFELAKLSVEHTTVRAPISGVISERFIKVGNMVQTNEQTFRITDFTPLLAIMFVPERELNKLSVGQPAEVYVDALPDESFIGRVKRISPIVDSQTGTFKVTVEIRDKSRRLKPGMFGRVNIVYDTHKNVKLVPREAVLTEDDEQAVFVVRDTIGIRTLVQTGYMDSGRIEIVAGIEPTDTVITIGQNNMRDSTLVTIIN